MDDFLLFHEDKTFLRQALRRIESLLDGLRLRLHGAKSRVYRTADGVTFLGWRVFPDCRRVVRSNVVRFRQRIRSLQRQYASGETAWDAVETRLRAWSAHAAHGSTWRLREAIFSRYPFVRDAGFKTGMAG